MTRATLIAAGIVATSAFLPFQNPPWPPTYALNQSTISMMCNSSGWYDAAFAAQFGIPSFDWSNAKAQWAVAKPMDCEERMLTQATAVKAANPAAHVFGYRNLVKALPWFTTVRTKLVDPAYSGFFLRFKPGGAFPNGSYHVPACDTTYDPPLCSVFYHDQEQSPAVPSPDDPNPDGACVGHCDCGGVPCGEYLFDHRNGTMLRSWLLEEVIGNGLGPVMSGYFIDDFWCSNIINGTGNCNDPVQGPTEIDRNSAADMGLSDNDIRDITQGWLDTMTAVQSYMLQRGAYTWSLIPGQDNANASPLMLKPNTCASTVRRACSETSPWSTAPLLFGVTPGNTTNPLPNLAAEIKAFLVMRGSHAYMGYGEWGMTWPVGRLPYPSALSVDYGQPLAPCVEVSTGSFQRAYSKGNITFDCSSLV